MDNSNKQQDTVEKLKRIFKEGLGINLDNYGEEAFGMNLLGNTFRLSSRDLLYLYYKIEKEFSVKISEEEVVEGNFNNLNSLLRIISRSTVEAG